MSPQTTDDFDRLVLQSPNSSIAWLGYMAFHLETTEIDKARAIAERALKTISFRWKFLSFCMEIYYKSDENEYYIFSIVNAI